MRHNGLDNHFLIRHAGQMFRATSLVSRISKQSRWWGSSGKDNRLLAMG